jgi:hypothetical protein
MQAAWRAHSLRMGMRPHFYQIYQTRFFAIITRSSGHFPLLCNFLHNIICFGHRSQMNLVAKSAFSMIWRQDGEWL